MKIQSEPTSRLRIDLDGAFLGHNALSLAKRLPLSDLADARYVVLSLAKVCHIDEAGLAMLVRLYSHLRVRGCRLEFADVPVFVHELLERVGFTRLVSYADGLDRQFARHTIMLGRQVEA